MALHGRHSDSNSSGLRCLAVIRIGGDSSTSELKGQANQDDDQHQEETDEWPPEEHEEWSSVSAGAVWGASRRSLRPVKGGNR